MHIPGDFARALRAFASTMAVLCAAGAAASTITVTNTADSGAGSLRAAIASAVSGDAIAFSSNTTGGGTNFYDGSAHTITLNSGQLTLGSDVTIQGPGANLLTISGNSASRVFQVNSNVTATLDGLTIANGRVSGNVNRGGGIHNSGTLTVLNSTLSGNSVSGDTNFGGGISNEGGTLTVLNSTLSGNSASGNTNFGGGINNEAGTMTVLNSTLSGNSASNGNNQGGAIYTFGGTVTTINCTISGNAANSGAASAGGGIMNSTGTVNARNTIIAGNTAAQGPDVYRSLNSQGHNVLGNTSGATVTATTGDKFDAAASPLNLGALAFNGGPTQTLALLPGSVAIAAGDDCVAQSAHCSDSNISQLTTDQRGYARSVGPHVDIGAVEFQTSLVVTNTNDSGLGSLRDALAGIGSGGDVTFNIPTTDPGYNSTTGIFTIALATVGDNTFGPSALLLDKAVTIDGGASRITISRNPTAQPTRLRLFYVSPTGNLTLKKVTLSGGLAKGGDGSSTVGGGAAGLGGAAVNAGVLQLADCTLTSNQARGGSNTAPGGLGGGSLGGDNDPATDGRGPGGFGVGGGGGRSNGGFGGGGGGNGGGRGGFGGGGAGYNGGAALFGEGGFGAGNGTSANGGSAGGGGAGLGGAIFNYGGALLITNSTLASNSAISGTSSNNGSGYGGAIFNLNGIVTTTNATIASNIAAQGGGAIYSLGDNGVATQSGPALVATSSVNPAKVTLNNAILSGSNDGANTPAAVSDYVQNTNDSGNGGGAGFVGSAGANSIIQTRPAVANDFAGTATTADPKLNSLGNYGGVTQTLQLQVTSPAIDAGNNALALDAISNALTTDQRGFGRIQKGKSSSSSATVDLGAYELIGVPTFTTSNINVTVGSTQPINLATASGASPSGGSFSGQGVNSANGTFDPTGLPRGVYTITYTVNDGFGGTNSSTFTITVTEQPSLVVTTTNDAVSNTDGLTSLRETLAYAATLTGPQTVTFSNSALNGATNFHDGAVHTITLTSGDLRVLSDVTITGPGADLLTVRRDDAVSTAFRIFTIAPNTNTAMSGLTISGGRSIGGSKVGNPSADGQDGGGIHNAGTLALTRVMIGYNIAGDGSSGSGGNGGRGGGVFNSGTLNIIDSTITGNSSGGGGRQGGRGTGGLGGGGGGIGNVGILTVINTTISANSTGIGGENSAHGGNGGDGAGIHNNGTVAITNCTVSNNSTGPGGTGFMTDGSSGNGGGLWNGSSANLRNTIVGLNTSGATGPDLSGTFTSQGYNLIGDSSGATIAATTGDQIGGGSDPTIDPKLNPLGNYGGPTQTLALRPDSPALNAGADCVTEAAHCGDNNISQLTTDQRGFARKSSLAVDIGAYELQAPAATNDSYNANEDAALSVSVADGVLKNDTPGNGGTLTAAVAVGPGHASAFSLNSDGSFSYTAAQNFNGQDSFTYTVMESDGISATGTVTITIGAVNDAPGATTDSYTVNEDAPLSVDAANGVLANDTDADTANSSLAAILVSGPGQASSFTLNSDGSFNYTPNSNSNGQDSFSYKTNDGSLDSNAATVTITVNAVNDAPTATSDTLTNVAENSGARTIAFSALTGNDSAGPANESGQSLAVNAVGNATGGTVTISGTDVLFTPTPNYNGPASFTYTVEDNGTSNSVADPQTSAAAATVSFNVTEVNNAPTAGDDSLSAVNEDSAARTIPFSALLGNDSAGPANESSQTLAVSLVANAVGGSVVISGTDVIFTPAQDFNGPASFTYTAQDNGTTNGAADPMTSAAATVTFTINEVNDAPTFSKGGDESVNEDAGAQSVSNWATNISVGPANESTQTAAFTLSNDNNSLFAAQPAISASGTLTYTPANNTNGSATITVTLNDDGGTANGGQDSATQTFVITVSGVNDAPSFTKGADQIVGEDAGAQTVPNWATNIASGSTNESAQTVSFIVSNDNNALFSTPPALDASGTLTYTPAANANGSATGSVTAKDDGGTANGGQDTSNAQTFTITFNPVNDAPTFTKGADQMVNEDAGTQNVANWATNILVGPANESTQTAAFTLSNDNNSLFAAQPAISAGGTLTYTPANNTSGSATITATLRDDGGTANGGQDNSVQTFVITVSALNDAPSFSKGADQTVNEDASAQSVPNWATNVSSGPANESAQMVIFIVSNDNNGLFATQPALDASGTLTYTPAANANGSATVSVTAKDDAGTSNGGQDTSAAQTFTITVSPVNDAPTFTKGNDQTVNEDAGAQSIASWATNISTGPGNESTQTAAFTLSNDNNSLFVVQPAISGTGTLTYTPANNSNGSATITVTLKDDGDTANGGQDNSVQTFVITVTALNDAPSFTKGADQTVNEDAGTQSVANWATNISVGPANESAQTAAFTLSNDNNSLFAVQPAISGTGTLTYTPANNSNGSATITVTLKDDGGTANGGKDSSVQTFVVTVNALNDAPSFSKGADQAVNEDAGAQTVSGWASNISAGTPDESGQAVSFTTNNDNNALFSVQPSLAGTGTLTYTAAPNANGTATVSVTLKDDGGTAAGGKDTSAPQTFTITVNAVNDAPQNTLPGTQNVVENSSLTFSSANGNQIAIADLDAGSNAVQVSLAANHGTVTLSSTAGLSFSAGDGNADPAMTFTGSIATINAALNGMTFAPAPGYDGAANLQVATNDQGNTGSGGALTDTDAVSIAVADGGTLAFSSGSYTVAEDGGTVTITVNRAGGTAGEARVDYATSNGTALAGSDYTARNGTLVFGNGVTTQSFTVPITNDGTDEADETIGLTLSNVAASGSPGAVAQATLTINDNDAAAVIEFSSASVNVGEGAGTVSLTLTKTGSTALNATVHYATSDGTAKAGSDYANTSADVTFAPDETSKVITVPITNDAVLEQNETFQVTLSSPSAATLGANSAATITIIDNDTQPTLQWSATSYSVNENGGSVVLTVTRLEESSEIIYVHYLTSDGTAKAGADYIATSGDLIFAPGGPASQTINVPITDDNAAEGNETFNATLTAVAAGAVGAPQVTTVTIVDNESAPTPTPTPTATPNPTATPTPTPTPTATPAQALNISTRLRVEPGDKVMIAGFIITGNASKPVVIRGMGSSLTAANVPADQVLLDPVLELRGPNGSLITSNDNWKQSPQKSQIEGTPFQPTDDREAVILATLPPGAYTAILTGKDQTSGIGLVEVYDNSQAADSALANISTRGFVRTGDNVMIGGFMLGGNPTSTRIVIRGIGPTLANSGLSNVLADPNLELHDGNGTLMISNDNWQDDPASAAELLSNGLTPQNSFESAIFTTLPPGAFTVILAGNASGTGIGLVEIYNLK